MQSSNSRHLTTLSTIRPWPRKWLDCNEKCPFCLHELAIHQPLSRDSKSSWQTNVNLIGCHNSCASRELKKRRKNNRLIINKQSVKKVGDMKLNFIKKIWPWNASTAGKFEHESWEMWPRRAEWLRHQFGDLVSILRNFSVNASTVTTPVTWLQQPTVCFQVPTFADVPNQKTFTSQPLSWSQS